MSEKSPYPELEALAVDLCEWAGEEEERGRTRTAARLQGRAARLRAFRALEPAEPAPAPAALADIVSGIKEEAAWSRNVAAPPLKEWGHALYRGVEKHADDLDGEAEEGACARALRGLVRIHDQGMRFGSEAEGQVQELRDAWAAARSALYGAAASGEGRASAFDLCEAETQHGILPGDTHCRCGFAARAAPPAPAPSAEEDDPSPRWRRDSAGVLHVTEADAPPARGNAPRSDEEAPVGSGGRAEGGSGRSGAPSALCGSRPTPHSGLYCGLPLGHAGVHVAPYTRETWA